MQVFQRRLIDTAQQQASLQDIILKNKTRTGQTPTMVQSYTYAGSNPDGSPIAFGTSTQFNIPIQGDSDFIITSFSGLVFDNATGLQIVAPLVKLQITDNSSQRSMFSNPVFFSLVMGNGGFPYILQEPRLVTANTQLVIAIYNNLSAQNINVQVTMNGDRVYY